MAGRLPQAWLDELRDRADIVQVVSRYVQLNPKGGRYWGLCPFHGEKTPSFSVNPQRQMYYCFGCHAGGSAITFVMEMEHLDFMDAVKLLAEQVHMEVPELTHSREDSESKSRKERLYEANKQCARFFHAQLWKEEFGNSGVSARTGVERQHYPHFRSGRNAAAQRRGDEGNAGTGVYG